MKIKFLIKPLIILISIIIAYILFRFIEYKVYEMQENKYNKEINEYNKDILLKLQIIYNGSKLRNSEIYYDYYYVINRDGTLTISYGNKAGCDENGIISQDNYELFRDVKGFTGFKNPDYEQTIILSDIEMSNIESIIDEAFKSEMLNYEVYVSGDVWRFSVYYDGLIYTIYSVFSGIEEEMYDTVFNLIDEIISLAPSDFEGNVVYLNTF